MARRAPSARADLLGGSTPDGGAWPTQIQLETVGGNMLEDLMHLTASLDPTPIYAQAIGMREARRTVPSLPSERHRIPMHTTARRAESNATPCTFNLAMSARASTLGRRTFRPSLLWPKD